MLDGFATQHDDKRLVTMGIYIGNGVAKTLNQFCTAFLHGKALCACLFVIFVFLCSFALYCKRRA
jgi:hypothetical protein